MKKIIVTHNGMTVEFFNNDEMVELFINKKLEFYKHLNPVKIVDTKFDDNKRIVIYEYYTLYKEMFLIEIEEL